MDVYFLMNCKKCGVQRRRPNRMVFCCKDCKKEVAYPRVYYKNRQIVFHRDAHKCQCCGDTKKILAHHIDCDKYNNSPSNLITLCNQCHLSLHRKYTKKQLRQSNIYKLFPKEFRFGIFGKRFNNPIIKESKPKKEIHRFFSKK